MTWTAEVIHSGEDAKGHLNVNVRFVNDETGAEIKELFVTGQGQDEDWLKRSVKRKIAELDGVKELAATVAEGAIDLSEEPAVETKEDAARAAFSADLERLNAYYRASSVGISVEALEDFAATKQRLNENFRPEYLDLF